MKREHQVIIAKARRDGMKPVELASELMAYTLVEAMRDASAASSIPYSKMSEIQQDAAIQQWTEATKEAIDLAIQVISSAGTRTVRMELTSVAVGKKLKVSGVVAGNEEFKHDLIDLANDQGTAIVILNERDYLQGLDGIHGEKDQKPLDLESDPADKPEKKARASTGTGSATSAGALAKKATELPQKLLEDARTFIRDQQVCTVSGIQNGLKIGAVKATAVLDQMAEEGIVEFVGDSKSGEYKLARAKPEEFEMSALSPDEKADLVGAGDTLEAELTDAIYEQIKAKVLESGKVSIGALSITLNLDDELVEQAVERLELEGIVTEENEVGMRAIVGAE